MTGEQRAQIAASLHEALRDLGEWVSLAKRQREVLGDRHAVAPTSAGIEESNAVLRRIAFALSVIEDGRDIEYRCQHQLARESERCSHGLAWGTTCELCLLSCPQCWGLYADAKRYGPRPAVRSQVWKRREKARTT